MNNLFLSSLLKIESDIDELTSFKFGVKGGVSNEKEHEQPLVTIRYVINNDLIVGDDTESLTMELNHDRQKLYVVKIKELLFGAKAVLTVDYTLDIPVISANKWYLLWSNLRGTCAFQTPEQIMANISFAKLVEKGALPIHCGAVEKDGKGYLLIAPSNTGKTLTTAKLAKEYDFRFIAEDIAIVKDNVVYGCPYTATDIPPHLDGPVVPKANFITRFLFPKRRKGCVADCFTSDQIVSNAPICGIFFLKRSSENYVKDIDKEEALINLDKSNSLEFKYQDDDILGELWFRYNMPSLRDIGDLEYSRLKAIVVSNVFMREITVSNPNNFSELITNNIDNRPR